MAEVASWSDIFDGELSDVDSIASVKPPATVSSIHEQEDSRKGVDPRPKRSTIKHSYAESDTSDDNDMRYNPITGSKRKRDDTLVENSPKKRVKDRGRSFGAGAFQPSKMHGEERPTASQTQMTSSQPLPLTPTPLTPSKAFVRLDLHGVATRSTNNNGYWWPAQKVESGRMDEVTYRLYGDDGNGPSRLITLAHYSFPYLQPFWVKPPIPRYTDANFQSGEAVDKKKFKDAVRELIRDDDDDDDEVESQDDLNASEPAGSDEETDSIPDWSPPSPSPYLEYVGQAVLCKGRPEAKEYWPAKVAEYIAPTKPSSKPRFKIDFFDWRVGELTRDCFYTQYDKDEAEFAACKLDTRKIATWIEKNSHTADEEDEPLDVDLASLPPPEDPPPKPRVFLEEMGIEEQFAYVIPFLQKILNESYPPSQERINRWMDPATRQIITNNPVQGGHLAEVEWNVFSRLVYQWALPKNSHSNRQTRLEEQNPPRALTLDRPRGSERYESLQLNDKTLFVCDVLVGEAVIQLLLFRAGKRAKLELLSDEEEQELYKLGERLSNEESTSILVRTVLEARARIRQRRGLKVENFVVTAEESTSRRRRNGQADKTPA